MIESKIAICPVCEKKTCIRIQMGYLSKYPIRVYCLNCRALMKGTFSEKEHLQLDNASVEECDIDNVSLSLKNADYIADISGELPCKKGCKSERGIMPITPFLDFTKHVKSGERVIKLEKRLNAFLDEMKEWHEKRSLSIQMLEDGELENLSKAVENRIGEYSYKCDNQMKTFQCIHEMMLDTFSHLYSESEQYFNRRDIIAVLRDVDKEKLDGFIERIGGKNTLISAFIKMSSLFLRFMDVYQFILPAESYYHLKNVDKDIYGMSTCSFSDIKWFYQDAYESILSYAFIPVGIDNIIIRNDYNSFSDEYKKIRVKADPVDEFDKYLFLDNGTRLNKYDFTEPMQSIVNVPANRSLRNGIGHNNYTYDGITQKVVAYGMKASKPIEYKGYLIDVAVDCINFVKSAINMLEVITFLLRRIYSKEDVRTLILPMFYDSVEDNSQCPCGSGLKFKRCCKQDFKHLKRNSEASGR